MGFYRSPWTNKDHPRMQLLTVEELLSGRTIDMPPIRHTNVTFKKGAKAKGEKANQAELPFTSEDDASLDESTDATEDELTCPHFMVQAL